MITNSLEWSYTHDYLMHQANVHVHMSENRQQVIKMINNISNEVTALSRAEVMVRRGYKNAATKILVKINDDINLVEEYILVAVLTR